MNGMLGEALDWQPVRHPLRAVLSGTTVQLEPVDPQGHAQALFSASHGPDADSQLWAYLSVGPFGDRAEFTAWLAICAASDDPLFFTVVDRATGRPSGMVSYLRITPVHGVIEIGNIWFGPALQRTRQATEAIFLLARQAFDDLGYRRLEWKCNALNATSRRAAERFGFAFEGVFRKHQTVKGRNHDTTWYAITDDDWPAIRQGFEEWLAPANFDSAGLQRRSLAELMRAASG